MLNMIFNREIATVIAISCDAYINSCYQAMQENDKTSEFVTGS